MSEEQNLEKTNPKIEKLRESIKDLGIMELMQKKMGLVKDLERTVKLVETYDFSESIKVLREVDSLLKSVVQVDTTKSSERVKLVKQLDKVESVVERMALLDKALTEKNRMVKALEKIHEAAESIPVIEEAIKKLDF